MSDVKPMDRGLIAHEWFHAIGFIADEVRSGAEPSKKTIALQVDGCTTLHGTEEPSLCSILIGGLAHAITSSNKPEALIQGLLYGGGKSAEILCGVFAADDWASVADKAGTHEMDVATRQAVLVIHAFDSNGMMTKAAERLAEKLGTQIGMLYFDPTQNAQMISDLFARAEEAATLPTPIWAIPNFAESKLEQFDLGLEDDPEQGFESFSSFVPIPADAPINAQAVATA